MSSTSPIPPPPHETEDTATSAPTTITTLPRDIIYGHILSRLDGATLAAASSTSSHLRRLCTAEHIWREICTATWPSLLDPTVSRVISTFPSGHHTIFSDAFPSLHHLPKSNLRRPSSPPPEELISAVDMHYKGKPVFSRVIKTETHKNWFMTAPFWISALEPNEIVPTPVKFARTNSEWLKHLEESLSLSWIIMDPTSKRAVNLSSRLPVSAGRHWLTRELEVVYAVAMVEEAVRVVVKVTCCGKVGGEVQVREVSLGIEHAEGRHVRGDEGVGIVVRAMKSGERKKVVDWKEKNEKFEVMKKERREAKHRRDKVKDVLKTLIMFFAFILLCCIAGV